MALWIFAFDMFEVEIRNRGDFDSAIFAKFSFYILNWHINCFLSKRLGVKKMS